VRGLAEPILRRCGTISQVSASTIIYTILFSSASLSLNIPPHPSLRLELWGLQGLWKSWFWNLVILDWWLIRYSSQLSAESWDGWLLESFYWQIHCCNTVGCLVHACWEERSPILESQQDARKQSWEQSLGKVWEDWTDSWIREGPLLYIRSPAKRFRRKQICPHTELCLVEDLNSLLLETSHRSRLWIVLWIVMYFGWRSKLCALDTSLDLCDLPIEVTAESACCITTKSRGWV